MPKQGGTTARGYGSTHQRIRRAWATRVAQGHTNCYRCNQPIQPGTPWDLGHTPTRDAFTGPEHTQCNRSEGATRGNQARSKNTTQTAAQRW